eukprot:14827617-Alexandrium_andersonii.AAC.1
MSRTRQREKGADTDTFCIGAQLQALQSSVSAHCGVFTHYRVAIHDGPATRAVLQGSRSRGGAGARACQHP